MKFLKGALDLLKVIFGILIISIGILIASNSGKGIINLQQIKDWFEAITHSSEVVGFKGFIFFLCSSLLSMSPLDYLTLAIPIIILIVVLHLIKTKTVRLYVDLDVVTSYWQHIESVKPNNQEMIDLLHHKQNLDFIKSQKLFFRTKHCYGVMKNLSPKIKNYVYLDSRTIGHEQYIFLIKEKTIKVVQEELTTPVSYKEFQKQIKKRRKGVVK